MIARERETAASYRREAKRRSRKNPGLAAEILVWAKASENRAERLRAGPLFGSDE